MAGSTEIDGENVGQTNDRRFTNLLPIGDVNLDVADKVKLSWAGDFQSLKQFVQQYLVSKGEWSSPGGEKKMFKSNDGNTTICWWKNKKFLKVTGEEAQKVKGMLWSVLSSQCDSTSAGSTLNINPSGQTDTSTNGDQERSLSNLSTEIEGIKLDVVISESRMNSIIRSNKDTINLVREDLTGLNKAFKDLEQRFCDLASASLYMDGAAADSSNYVQILKSELEKAQKRAILIEKKYSNLLVDANIVRPNLHNDVEIDAVPRDLQPTEVLESVVCTNGRCNKEQTNQTGSSNTVIANETPSTTTFLVQLEKYKKRQQACFNKLNTQKAEGRSVVAFNQEISSAQNNHANNQFGGQTREYHHKHRRNRKTSKAQWSNSFNGKVDKSRRKDYSTKYTETPGKFFRGGFASRTSFHAGPTPVSEWRRYLKYVRRVMTT